MGKMGIFPLNRCLYYSRGLYPLQNWGLCFLLVELLT